MLKDALQEFKLALAFLTRLPVRLEHGRTPPALAVSAPMFPLVGALLGLIAAAVYGLAWHLALTPFLAATLAIAALIVATGGLHEDGLGDMADGFGGGRTRADRLRIMRDPRTGSFAVIALVLALLLRIAALAALAEPAVVAAALIAAGAVSRALLPLAMAALPPARTHGLAATAGRPHPLRAGAAVLIGAAVAFALLPPEVVVAALLGAGGTALGVAFLARRGIGGLTGDVLGAIQQAAEIAFLLAVVAGHSW
jgi:adenosylcobinamide-GDP ribazoletransferase